VPGGIPTSGAGGAAVRLEPTNDFPA
jgi:hypothetical protein